MIYDYATVKPTVFRWHYFLLSLVAGLALTVIPLPEQLVYWRPEWISLLVLYWLLHGSQRFGLVFVFISGLVLDITTGTLLGQHTLGLLLVSAVFIRLQTMIRVYPQIQQAIIVSSLLVIKLLVVLWVGGMTGREPESTWLFFMPAVSSLFIWPLLSWILDSSQSSHH